MQFHIARALKLLVDHIIHARAGINEAGGNNRKRAAVLDVTGGTKEAFGRIERHGVNATGEGATTWGHIKIVGPGEASDRVHENDHILTTLNETFRAFESHLGDFGVILDGLIKSRSNYIALNRAAHIRHLFGAFTDEEHHEITVGVVDRNTVSNRLQEHRLARFGGRDDQTALAAPNGGNQVNEAGVEEIGFSLEFDLLVGENRGKLVERRAFPGRLRVNAVNQLDAQK